MLLFAQVERLASGLKELKRLLPAHYAELSEHRARGYDLDPDYNTYLALEASGQLIYVTLRSENGILLGYFVGFLTRDLHYRVLSLKMDIVYVVEAARGHRGGKELLRTVMHEAKKRGAELVLMNFKESHRAHMEALLRECEFKPFESIWAKWLPGAA